MTPMLSSARFLFLFTLIFAPLAFGTVELWSLTVMEVSCLAGLLLAVGAAARPGGRFYAVPGLLPVLLLPAFALVQLVPLPAAVLEVLSPAAHAVYRQSLWVVDPGAWMPLSLHPAATLAEAFRFASYGAFYILTVQLCAEPAFLKKTVSRLILFAALLAVFAIVQFFLVHTFLPGFKDKLLFFRTLRFGGSPFGPYVNRNHFAGLMEMLFPLALAGFLNARPTSAYTKLRQRIADISSRPSTNIYLLTGYAALLTGLSVFLSLSRSGIVCLGVALAGFALVVAAKQPDRGRHLTIVSLAVAILISVGWFGWEPIVERFERIFDTGYVAEEGRAIIWKDTLGIIADFPATGSGFGTYRDLYPHYRTPHTETLTTHAHGDYLELAAEGGLAGLALAAWFWAAVMAASWRAFAGRRDPESVTLFAGAFTGILAILLHSVTDFNLQIGANGLYFFFLAGLLVSAAHTRFKVRRPVTYLARVRIRPAVWIGAGGLLLAANLAFGVGGLLGQLYFSGFKEYRYTGTPPEDTLVRIRRMASRGTVVDPLGATHFVSLGDTEQLLGNAAAALNAYTAAVRRAPCLPLNLQRLAGSLSESGNREAADRLFRAGIDRDPSRPDGYRRHAEWLLAGGERARGIEALSEALQRELRLDRKRFDEYLVVMIRRGLDVAQMRRAIPQQVRPTIYLAEFLEATDRPEAAGEVFQQALALARTDAGAGASDFQRMRKFYAAKGREEDALRVLVAACEALPEDIGLRMALGDLYRKLGIEYRAREEYEQVLILDPDYRAAKQRLGME